MEEWEADGDLHGGGDGVGTGWGLRRRKGRKRKERWSPRPGFPFTTVETYTVNWGLLRTGLLMRELAPVVTLRQPSSAAISTGKPPVWVLPGGGMNVMET